MVRLLTDALGYVLLGLVLAVTATPVDIPIDCSAQLHMPCNVTLEEGTFSLFGQPWDGSGGVSAPINFTSSYKCGSSDKYVLHLEWKPSSDVSFDFLTGYAINIRQEYNEFDEDGFDKFHLMFTVNNSEYVGKAYKVNKLDFSYDLPGVLISGWVYTVILYCLPTGTGIIHKVKEVDLMQANGCSASMTEMSTTTELPYTESSSSSKRQVSTPDDDKTQSSTTSRISQSAPPIDVKWSAGFSVAAFVIVIAVVATVAVVYRLHVWRGGAMPEPSIITNPKELSSAVTHFTEFPTATSTDSGIGDDPVGKANDEYDLDSLSISSSRCSSFVPVTNC